MNYETFRHVNYQDFYPGINIYFSQDTVNYISKRVTELLRDVYEPGIIVNPRVIVDVMNSVYNGYRPSTGDIYSRYTIPSNENDDYVDEMIQQTISVIVQNIKTEMVVTRNNLKLTPWVTLMGDFNDWGIRAHAPIKTRKRGPNRMMFNMNY